MKNENFAMLCDFYEFTMANGYFKKGFQNKIVYFDLFFRTIPDGGGFAIAAGLSSDLLICKEEDPEHINANIVAVRAEDKDAQWVKDLIEVLSSEDTKKFIEETFKGTIIPYCQEPKKNA